MNAMQEIESGNFAVPRWLFFPPDSIRVVNWNIDRGLKLSGVIEFLAGAKADIILLQEADLNARRTHHLNVAKEIAQTLEMNYAPFQERLGGRMALVSAVNIAGKTIVVYNLHLESRGDDNLRCSQLDETLDDARQYNWDTTILLAGDFNLDVSQAAAASAISRAQFQDAFANQHVPTTPGSFLDHGRTIDWIFTRGRIRASQPRVHRSVSASDHYPLSINVAFV